MESKLSHIRALYSSPPQSSISIYPMINANKQTQSSDEAVYGFFRLDQLWASGFCINHRTQLDINGGKKQKTNEESVPEIINKYIMSFPSPDLNILQTARKPTNRLRENNLHRYSQQILLLKRPPHFPKSLAPTMHSDRGFVFVSDFDLAWLASAECFTYVSSMTKTGASPLTSRWRW